jgi:hypothetical protein
MGVVLWNNATSVSGMTTPAGRGPNVGWCARAVISTELRARAAAGESKAALAKAFGVSRETVYSYLRIPSATIASSLTAGEDRPTPDITKYDQLLTRTPDPISPTEDQDATPQEADEKPPAATGAQRKRTPAGAPDPELVTVERDPAGGYRVSDPDRYLGRIERQVKVSGGRGRWQAVNDNGNLITNRGPWNTVNDAVVGLLLYHQDLYARRSGGR